MLTSICRTKSHESSTTKMAPTRWNDAKDLRLVLLVATLGDVEPPDFNRVKELMGDDYTVQSIK